MPNEPTPANPPADPAAPVYYAKGNFVADVPPTSTDDQTKGFYAGSRWYVPATNQLFIFVPNAALDGGQWVESLTANPVAETETDFSSLRQ
jgi:hypothetical protein